MSFQCIVLNILLFTILGGIRTQDLEPPPKIKASYEAMGELIETVDKDLTFQIQIAFEETYDSETKDAVFRIWEMGTSVTFTENYETNQTFRYSKEEGCQEMTIKEWVKTEYPNQLLNFENSKGRVRFSLKQLFALSDKFLKESAVPTTYRGIPAKQWMYEINGTEPDSDERKVINVYSYWSDASWDTTSSEDSVPLGYVISQIEYEIGKTVKAVDEKYINVFGIATNTIDHKLFEPVQGLVCPNRKQTIKFPDVTNIRALAFHSEVLFPFYSQIKYVDTWFDPRNKLVRVDMERIKDETPIVYDKNRKYQSEMVLGKLGIVYRLAYYKGELTCSILPIKGFDLDIQNLINFKDDLNNWSIGKMFGLNQTSYVYIGKTVKRDMPCHLFQGKRTDWPEPSDKVESLWEWCFSITNETKGNSVIFRNGEYGLVSARIKVLNSNRSTDLPKNFTIYHNFYDVNSVDPSLMDATNFDIGKCFQENEKRRLQFTIDWDVTDENIQQIENLTSDVNFLLNWRNALYKYTTLDPNSLRISNVKSMVANKNFIVKFSILAPHKDLPRPIKSKEILAFDAEKKLRDNIQNDNFFVTHTLPTGKKIPLHAVRHSLKLQVNSTFERHVVTTTPSPISTTTTFTLNTDDDNDNTDATSAFKTTKNDRTSSTGREKSTSTSKLTTTTSITNKPTVSPTPDPLKDKKPLHKSGEVAGISIAMLLVGISIGSAGLFIKNNGLPPCLTRAFRR